MKKFLIRGFILGAALLLVTTTTGLAQDFCQGNFDYDDDVDGTDAAVFKMHFGRSFFKSRCPDDGPSPLARTGQTRCYDENGEERACSLFLPDVGLIHTGEDGDWQHGVQPVGARFTDNGDGTITDNLTGLMWLQEITQVGQRTWQQALDEVASFNLQPGQPYTDWRLPNVRELQSILDYGQQGPALPEGHPFLAMPTNDIGVWTGTTKMGVEPSPFVEAYGIDLEDGSLAGYGKADNLLFVLPVRGGR
jgi:hypothetical protein